MKDTLIQQPDTPVTLVSTVIWALRIQAWKTAGILVENTGANPISVWIETRVSDTSVYAPRPVDDLVSIPAGEARQFDADVSASNWVALLAVASGGSSTADGVSAANFPSGSLVSRAQLNPGVRVYNDTCFAVAVLGAPATTAPSFTAGIIELMER